MNRPATLLSLAASFGYLGATIFGGMYAGISRLEREIVQRREWLTTQDVSLAMIVATFIPARAFSRSGR
jgi:chromate transport protein ChrA